MKELTFKHLYKNKDGSIDYDKISKATGLTKSDAIFLFKSDFTLIDRALLVSGVFVGKRPIYQNSIFESKWDLKTCHHAPDDLTYISKLVANNGNDFNMPYQYFVMDSAGGILFSNCGVSHAIDEQGLIHLSTDDKSLDQYVYPASLKQCKYKCYYCHDESLDKLNNQVDSLASKKLIDRPSQAKSGFVAAIDPPQEREQ